MEAETGDEHGATGFVVAGIVDVLNIKRGEKAAPEVRGVKAFEDFFVAVSQLAVTQEKSHAAEGEIVLVSGNDSVHRKDTASAIVAAMPGIALREAAEFEGAVHFGIGERFVATVAPPETREQADL